MLGHIVSTPRVTHCHKRLSRIPSMSCWMTAYPRVNETCGTHKSFIALPNMTKGNNNLKNKNVSLVDVAILSIWVRVVYILYGITYHPCGRSSYSTEIFTAESRFSTLRDPSISRSPDPTRISVFGNKSPQYKRICACNPRVTNIRARTIHANMYGKSAGLCLGVPAQPIVHLDRSWCDGDGPTR